jgi:uncharacterized surface protein with fasciclin (FAS1) repeats
LSTSFTQRFARALAAAGLRDSLNTMPRITVFAPYDPAFDELSKKVGPRRFAALLTDPRALAPLLRYHVIDQRLDRAGLLRAATVHPLGGGQLRIADAGPTIKIIDGSGAVAYVLCGNIQTANATLYLIDRVLSPNPS